MLSLVFDAVDVDVFIVYYFVLFCRPGIQNNLLLLNAKPNSYSTLYIQRIQMWEDCRILTASEFKFELHHASSVNSDGGCCLLWLA